MSNLNSSGLVISGILISEKMLSASEPSPIFWQPSESGYISHCTGIDAVDVSGLVSEPVSFSGNGVGTGANSVSPCKSGLNVSSSVAVLPSGFIVIFVSLAFPSCTGQAAQDTFI